MTERWKVASEEFYRNDKDVLLHQFYEEMMMHEVRWLITQVPNLPTRNLMLLHDATIESMNETKDPDVRSLLEGILRVIRQEIEHRERSEGGGASAWMFA